MARANDSKRFWSIISLSGHLAREYADAMGMHVQARHDKLGKRMIQTSVSHGAIHYRRAKVSARIKRMFQLNDGFKRAFHSHVANETRSQ
jgi:hypothetical protein